MERYQHIKIQWIYISGFLIFSGIIVSALKLWVPYSYWLDELYSVNASSVGFSELYRFLLTDVHPPLYQLILKLWITIFGSSEPATRTLSWLFALSTIYPLYKFGNRYDTVFLICALMYLCTNILFLFYANEARSYAMTNFLSMMVIINYPFANDSKVSYRFLIYCLLLSLTHYFGLIYIGVVLMTVYFKNLIKRKPVTLIVLTGVASLMWPLHHMINGALLNKTGGSFWIKVSGIVDSFNIAATGITSIPKVILESSHFIGVFLVLSLGALAISNFSRNKNLENNIIWVILTKASLITFLFLIFIALVDLHTPISTKRNYIVILPLASIIFGCVISLIHENFPKCRFAILSFALLLSLVALILSSRGVFNKSKPSQDWKNAISLAVQNSKGRQIYVKTYDGIVDHYLKINNYSKDDVKSYQIGDKTLIFPSLLIYGHINNEDYEKLLVDLKLLKAKRVFPLNEPNSGYPAGVFLID